MANTGYIKSRSRTITPAVVSAALEDINRRRFGGHFTIEAGERSWAVSHETGEIYLWLITTRTIGIQPPHAAWLKWVDAVLRNELAVVLGARLSDEGVAGSWDGKRDEYPTLDDYIRAMWADVPEHERELFAERWLSMLPEGLPQEFRRRAIRAPAAAAGADELP